MRDINHTCTFVFLQFLHLSEVPTGCRKFGHVGSNLILPTGGPRPAGFKRVGSFDPVSEVPTII
jgi:hypothetical protein